MKRLALLAGAGLISLGLAACGGKDAGEPMSEAKVAQQTADPAGAVEAVAARLKENDLLAAVQLMVPAAKLDELRGDWKQAMAKETPSEEERAEFAANMAKLTAPGAEQALYAELEPALVKFETEMAAQMPMMIGMGQGFAMQGIQASEDMTPAQKQQGIDMINALGGWLQTAKLTDRDLAKKGIGIVVATARQIDLKTLDELRALDFDQAMGKAGVAFGGIKDLFALYGLDMNQSFASLKAKEISREGAAAKVGFSYSFLGKELSGETEMIEQDGRWYGKDTVEQLVKGMAGVEDEVADDEIVLEDEEDAVQEDAN
ncbi:MAG: hypothetical protein RBT79_03455 [Chiayiivirga sp.]|jgi:hypothetical protein|uniref:DUF2059 domain-containing protein n=1 Tax=Denitratimonas tolerans TaxID=1338420 RepID=A0AAW9R3J5_9GAMM|nr:hypothetical protein [Xanthomonadaceae bacterium]MDX9764015.1 hypothetical protein [Chiayiivirga sp.]MEB2314787.1 hypothetical protein [Xanthomonadaceae bacterium]